MAVIVQRESTMSSTGNADLRRTVGFRTSNRAVPFFSVYLPRASQEKVTRSCDRATALRSSGSVPGAQAPCEPAVGDACLRQGLGDRSAVPVACVR